MSGIRGRHWQPDWRLWLLALCLFPLLVGLGIWQWHRAEEKTELFARWQQTQPEQWPSEQTPRMGAPVALQGHFDERYHWLLDNRTFDGRPGYEVLSLFYPESGSPVVVNRGWTPAPPRREQLPAITPQEGQQTLVGRMAPWPEPPVLGAEAEPEGWPRRVQSLAAEQVAETTGETPAAFIRLIEPGPGGYRTRSDPGVMRPERHRAYAFQWFSLALALLVLTIIASFRKERPDNT
ncbi:SURF1 family protein [Marinobacteraceae bacterium S3BR75-40.1]